MDLSITVIPIKLQPKVFFPFPILTNFIVFFQYSHKVVGMFLTNILHSEVINHQCEADGTPQCVQKPGVTLLCMYPCFPNRCSSSSCAKRPACGSPYMLLRIYTYTYPSFASFALRPYSSMTSLDKLVNLSLRYLYLASGVFR